MIRSQGLSLPSVNQEGGPTRHQICWHLYLRLPSLQVHEKYISDVYKPPSLRNFVTAVRWTKTGYQMSFLFTAMETDSKYLKTETGVMVFIGKRLVYHGEVKTKL